MTSTSWMVRSDMHGGRWEQTAVPLIAVRSLNYCRERLLVGRYELDAVVGKIFGVVHEGAINIAHDCSKRRSDGI